MQKPGYSSGAVLRASASTMHDMTGVTEMGWNEQNNTLHYYYLLDCWPRVPHPLVLRFSFLLGLQTINFPWT